MKTTGSRRIFLNVLVSYGRSFYALALGLLTARWLLLSLGEVDYGLLGLVGGLVVFVEVFNNLLADAVSRFYAVAVGACAARGHSDEALLECRRWFTAAVQVHTAVPLALMSVGWPLGVYAVEHWLVIPPDRVAATLWVWHFSCVTALTAMLNVPFRAMYTAKQEIAEMTIVNMMAPTLQAILLAYMIGHPGDWLARYALLHCLVLLLPRLIVFVRAVAVYSECRIERRFLGCWRDMGTIARYAGWTAFGTLGQVFQAQGLALIVNGLFGPARNAAVAIANRVSARANTFASSIVGAFSPAIANTYGAGDRKGMLNLAARVCKLSSLIVAFVSIPLAIEMDYVLSLWLKHPPKAAASLCVCVVLVAFLDRLTSGLRIAVNAAGRIARFQLLTGLSCVAALPATIVLAQKGWGMMSVGVGLVLSGALQAGIRAWAAYRFVRMDIAGWLAHVAAPVVVLALAGVVAGGMVHHCLEACFVRVVAVVAVAETVMLPIAWFAVLAADERDWVIRHVLQRGRRPVHGK